MGRDGFLRLGFERRGGRTVLVERRFRLPLQALEPMELDDSGGLALMLLNPTGGLLGGDVLDTQVSLGPGSRVCLTTPSATRVYRTAGAAAVQRFSATVGDHAVLEYVPDHLIPSPGARLVQTTDITLAPGAAAILVDAWATGRIARDEAWRFAELDLGLIVRDESGLLLKDRAVLRGDRAWERLGASEGLHYVAAFVVVGAGRGGWVELAGEMTAALAAQGAVTAGTTPLGRGGVLGRILAPSAPELRSAIHTLWALSRRALWGEPPLDLRKL